MCYIVVNFGEGGRRFIARFLQKGGLFKLPGKDGAYLVASDVTLGQQTGIEAKATHKAGLFGRFITNPEQLDGATIRISPTTEVIEVRQ